MSEHTCIWPLEAEFQLTLHAVGCGDQTSRDKSVVPTGTRFFQVRVGYKSLCLALITTTEGYSTCNLSFGQFPLAVGQERFLQLHLIPTPQGLQFHVAPSW